MQKRKEKEISWLLKEKYSGKPTKQFKKDLKRLEKGEPVDFVIGWKEFLGCKIDLSKKPLIPRPETEFWVEKAIKEIKNPSSRGSSGQNLRILDMFAGSGCIGIAVLKNIRNARVTFSDNDKNAIKQIKINLKVNGVKDNFIVRQSDMFSNIKGKYDLVFANPPYIPLKNKSKVQKTVLKYEPKNALFGGADGPFYIKKFLSQAKNYLNSGGQIFMEFDGSAGSPQVPLQKKEIEKLLKQYGYKSWQFNKDQYGKWRWVSVFV